MTLSPKLGVVGISTLWHFRLSLPIQMFIKVASSPRLSGIGMPSPILWSHPLKMQRIVLLSSLLWWELGTNSLITGPGECFSFRRFTSKLSWSWYWYTCCFNWAILIGDPVDLTTLLLTSEARGKLHKAISVAKHCTTVRYKKALHDAT